MNGGDETPAQALYRRACAGDPAAQCELSDLLGDLAPGEPGVLAVAYDWGCEAMKKDEIAGAYSVARITWRWAHLAIEEGCSDAAVKNFATSIALLDGIAEEGDTSAADLIAPVLSRLPPIMSEGAVVDAARELRREALAHGD